MTERAKTYRRGMTLIHKESKAKILFGKWNADGSAGCLTKENLFLNVPRNELERDYISESEIQKKAIEKRRGEGW